MTDSLQAIRTKTGVPTVGIITPTDEKLFHQPTQERKTEVERATRGLQPAYQAQKDIGRVIDITG